MTSIQQLIKFLKFSSIFEMTKLNIAKNPTYLGITLDRKLKGKSHISQIADRGKRRLAFMRSVAGVKWGCTTETQANTFKTYVQPTLEYGMEVFPAAIPNGTKQLDIVYVE
jgi:hypothetical protein